WRTRVANGTNSVVSSPSPTPVMVRNAKIKRGIFCLRTMYSPARHSRPSAAHERDSPSATELLAGRIIKTVVAAARVDDHHAVETTQRHQQGTQRRSAEAGH